jgi:general stress protein YciG
MPKPLKKAVRKLKTPAKPKRPTDPNRAAHAMLAEHMARLEAEQPAAPLGFAAQYKAHMRKLGAKGGKASGAKRMENLTDEQRSGIALKAARARWAKAAKKR